MIADKAAAKNLAPARDSSEALQAAGMA